MLGIGLGLGRQVRRATPSASLVLDTLSVMPEAWLSLEKVKSDYDGPSLRIRRDSDNVETDIGFNGVEPDTGAILSFAGSDSAYVSRVYDKTGNGRHWSQAVAAYQPKALNAGALTLHGTKLVLSGGRLLLDDTSGIITGADGATILSLAATPNTSGYESLAWATTANSTRTELGVGIGSGGLSRVGYFRVTTLGTLSTITGTQAIGLNELTLSIVTANYVAGAAAMYTNGVSDGSRSIPAGAITDVSAEIATPSADISATVAMCGVFNSVLTPGDRAALTDYALARKAA